MRDFHRFPHTPHLAWLGDGRPRDDKVLSAEEARDLLSAPVFVEEKIDGANLGLSAGEDGWLRAQNRGQYLAAPLKGQFSRLAGWLAMHQATLPPVLGEDLILFGEWCAARHSIGYQSLPDWFVVFDVFEPGAGRYWSVPRRDALCARVGLAVVPRLWEGTASLGLLREMVETSASRFGRGPVEGLVVRRDEGEWLGARAKLVRRDFTQAIGEHWRSRHLVWNRLAEGTGATARSSTGCLEPNATAPLCCRSPHWS